MTATTLYERRRGDNMIDVVASRLDAMHGDMGEIRVVLRDLTAAVTKLAIVEERQGQAALAQERAFKVLECLEVRVAALEKAEPMQTKTSQTLWAVLYTLAGMAALFLFKKAGLL